MEVKTRAAGLNSHFHPCSCANTTAAAWVLQKPLQCRHVPKGKEKTPARTSVGNRQQQAATAQLAPGWGSACPPPQLFPPYFFIQVSTGTATRKIRHAVVGKRLSEGTFLVKRSYMMENSWELLAEAIAQCCSMFGKEFQLDFCNDCLMPSGMRFYYPYLGKHYIYLLATAFVQGGRTGLLPLLTGWLLSPVSTSVCNQLSQKLEGKEKK